MFYGQPWQIFEGFSYQQIAQWELFHKSKDFSTNISNLFFKVAKVSIQKVIGFGWVWIPKGKLYGRTLKAYQIRNKPNLDNTFKLYLSYRDLEGLCNSYDYFERLWKRLLAMIQQLGPSTFFVTFTSIKRIVLLSLKLYTHYMLQN